MSASEIKKDRRHLIWEDCVIRIIESAHVPKELIEYIHNNPVSKKMEFS